MRYFLAFLLFGGLAFASDEAEIFAVIDKTFKAMAARDGDALRSTLLPEARLYSMRGEEAASRGLEDFIKQIVASKSDLVERFTGKPQVSMRGRMAQVWGEYEFLRDGKFSHCGVDTVLLFKTATGWRIATLSYTVEPTGCPGH